jgi:hypothetical protein
VEFTDFSQSTAFQTLLAIDLSIQGFRRQAWDMRAD